VLGVLGAGGVSRSVVMAGRLVDAGAGRSVVAGAG
jgi:hypothetical protein